MNELEKLTAEEREKLYDAVPMITVLIAGANGNITDGQREWAKKVTHIRSFNNTDQTKEYYEAVEPRFEAKVDELIEKLPLDTDDRTKILSDKLAEINPILDKLGYTFHKNLYESFLSFARHVARADGGFLGIFAIDKEEEELIDLSMLKPAK